MAGLSSGGLSGGGLSSGGLSSGGLLGSYSRESPREDKRKRHEASAQHKTNVGWARTKGLRVVAFDGDRVSRLQDDITRYGGWLRLVGKVRSGELHGIIARDYERVSALVEVQEALFRMAWDAGGQVYTTQYGEERPQHFRPGSARGDQRRLLADRSRSEVEAIRARARQCRREKMAAGGHGGGRPFHNKYGYELRPTGRHRTDGTPIKDWFPIVGGEASDVIAFIRNCPLGPRPLARLLDDRGIPRPDGQDRPWAPSTIVKYRRRPDYDPAVHAPLAPHAHADGADQ